MSIQQPGPEAQQQPGPGPEAQQQSQGQPKSLEEIQLSALCNWCRNPLVMSEEFSDANFKDTGVKWHSDDTKNAEALYCEACLADEYRTSNPKSVIDRETLAEAKFSEIPVTV